MKKGFTLIEILIAVAIVAILSTVVFASGNAARKKARDASRISDLSQISIALEAYFENSSPNEYLERTYPNPANLTELYNALVSAKYLASMPVDPVTKQPYYYKAISSTEAGSNAKTSYCLGAHLEDPSSLVNKVSATCDDGSPALPDPTNSNYKVTR